jgi:hypothetical protein
LTVREFADKLIIRAHNGFVVAYNPGPFASCRSVRHILAFARHVLNRHSQFPQRQVAEVVRRIGG